jgi:hypothetical protein
MQNLSFLGWNEYFSSIQIYPGNKTRHIKAICEQTNVKNYKDVLFFDDDSENVYSVVGLGLTSVLIDKTKGLNSKILLNGLKLFHSKYNNEKLKS